MKAVAVSRFEEDFSEYNEKVEDAKGCLQLLTKLGDEIAKLMLVAATLTGARLTLDDATNLARELVSDAFPEDIENWNRTIRDAGERPYD